MLLPKIIRADRHWTDYRERKEHPLSRVAVRQVCHAILWAFCSADGFRDTLRALMADIGSEDKPISEKTGRIAGVLDYLNQKREFLYGCFNALQHCPDNILDEFCVTCNDDIVFGGVRQGRSYLDAGGQLVADTLCILNGRLSQEDVDHWWHGGKVIEVDGFLESLVAAGKRVEYVLSSLDDVFKGWPPRVVFEKYCIAEYLQTLKRLNLATEDDIRELDRSFEVVDKKNAASDVSEAHLQGKPGFPSKTEFEAHDATPAERTVLCVAEDAKDMRLNASGAKQDKEIEQTARDTSAWLTVSQSADFLRKEAFWSSDDDNDALSSISKACKNGEIEHEGKGKGKRRINPQSLYQWIGQLRAKDAERQSAKDIREREKKPDHSIPTHSSTLADADKRMKS